MAAVEATLKLIQEEDISAGASNAEAMMAKVAGAINYLVQSAGDFVGKIEYSALSEAQFAAAKGYDHTAEEPVKKWVLLKGQSIAGSQYASLTGVVSLPNAVGNGAFLGQITSGAMLAYQESQNRVHGHFYSTRRVSGGGGTTYESTATNYDPIPSSTISNYTTSSEGGAAARPNTVRVNIFLKINE